MPTARDTQAIHVSGISTVTSHRRCVHIRALKFPNPNGVFTLTEQRPIELGKYPMASASAVSVQCT